MAGLAAASPMDFLRAVIESDGAVSVTTSFETSDWSALFGEPSEENPTAATMNGIAVMAQNVLSILTLQATTNAAQDRVVLDVQLNGQSALKADVGISEEGVVLASDWVGEKPILLAWEDMAKAAENVDWQSLKDTFLNQTGLTRDLAGAEEAEEIEAPNTTALITAWLARAEVSEVTEQPEECDPAAVRMDITLTGADFEALADAVLADMEMHPSAGKMIENFLQQSGKTMDDVKAEIHKNLEKMQDVPVSVWLDGESGLVRFETAMAITGENEEEGGEFSAVIVRNTLEQGPCYNALFDTKATDAEQALKFTVLPGEDTTAFQAMTYATDTDGVLRPGAQIDGLYTKNRTDEAYDDTLEMEVASWQPTVSFDGDGEGEAAMKLVYPEEGQTVMILNGRITGTAQAMDAITAITIPTVKADAPVLTVTTHYAATEKLPPMDTADAIRVMALSEEEQQAFAAEVQPVLMGRLFQTIQLLPEDLAMMLMQLFGGMGSN